MTCSFFCGLLHSFGSAQKERSLVLYRVFVHDQVEHFLFFLLLSLSIYWHLFLLFLREASSHNQSAIFQPSKKVKRGEGKKHSTAVFFFFFYQLFIKQVAGFAFFLEVYIYILDIYNNIFKPPFFVVFAMLATAGCVLAWLHRAAFFSCCVHGHDRAAVYKNSSTVCRK